MNSRTDSGVVAVPASAPTTTPIAHGAFGGKLYSFFAENKITSCVSSAISSFAEKKRQYGLVQPGSFDSLGREARSEPTHFTAHLLMHNFVDVSLSQLLFEGGKLDLAKILSNQFQISHSMSLAAGGAPSTYHFGAVFVEKNNFLQGMVDNNGDLQGKAHLAATENLLIKGQWQLSKKPGYSMFQAESEYLGCDYTANMKAINFNPVNMTGILSAGYLQSITPRLLLGVEGVLQRPLPEVEEAGMTLIAKYSPKGPTNSVFTLNLQNLVGLQASYFHRVSESVELATDWQAVLAGPQRESVASISCKMEHRQASVRVQADTLGKVGLFLEERLFGRVALLISGEVDHMKGRNKFGVGLTIES